MASSLNFPLSTSKKKLNIWTYFCISTKTSAEQLEKAQFHDFVNGDGKYPQFCITAKEKKENLEKQVIGEWKTIDSYWKWKLIDK